VKRIKIWINKRKNKLVKKVQSAQCQQLNLQEQGNKYSKTHSEKNWQDHHLGNKSQSVTILRTALMRF
jgi:hypothetical protein